MEIVNKSKLLLLPTNNTFICQLIPLDFTSHTAVKYT